MTIAPQFTNSDYHHPRTSSSQLSRDLDILHRLSAQMPQPANRDINNNDLGDQMEICCDTNGFKPNKLSMTLNGDQLSVYGQQSNSTNKRFGATFLLPENVDPNNIYCQIGRNNQLSINMRQMDFTANANSMLPRDCAKTSGGLW